jgi:hypothetical protein
LGASLELPLLGGRCENSEAPDFRGLYFFCSSHARLLSGEPREWRFVRVAASVPVVIFSFVVDFP